MVGAEDDLADRLAPSKRSGRRGSRSACRRARRRGSPGFCVFNPCGFTRRVALEVPGFRGPIPVDDPVKAAEFTGDLARLVVEIPPLGFAWVPREGPAGTPQPKPRMKLADGLTVRNEFFECDVDSQTGGIRSFRDLRTRQTRFGQQLVYNPGSKMVARDIAVTNSGAALGEIISTGDLIDDHDHVLATFRQRFRAWLGRPVLELRIELDVQARADRLPVALVLRARGSAGATIAPCSFAASTARTRRPATRGRSRRTTSKCDSARSGRSSSPAGLPFIQRHGSRMADVILVPEGEQARSFELLLATDRDVPMQTAVGLDVADSRRGD